MPSSGDLPDLETEPASPVSPALAGGSHGMRDLNSLPEYQTLASALEGRVLTTGPPGKSPTFFWFGLVFTDHSKGCSLPISNFLL